MRRLSVGTSANATAAAVSATPMTRRLCTHTAPRVVYKQVNITCVKLSQVQVCPTGENGCPALVAGQTVTTAQHGQAADSCIPSAVSCPAAVPTRIVPGAPPSPSSGPASASLGPPPVRKSISRSQLPFTSSVHIRCFSCGRSPDGTCAGGASQQGSTRCRGAPWNGLRRRNPLPSILFRAACSTCASA